MNSETEIKKLMSGLFTDTIDFLEFIAKLQSSLV